MYTVKIEAGGSPSNYWALLATEDTGGKVHKKEISCDREGTVHSNILQAMIDAVKSLNRRCMLDIYVESDHLAAAWQQGWVKTWAEHEWKNAKGHEVKNRQQWEELKYLLDGHAVRMFYKEKNR